jgi:ParB family chromosome partitioning protein
MGAVDSEGDEPTHNVMGAVDSEGDESTHNVMGALETDSTPNAISEDEGDSDLPTHNVMGETETPNLSLNDQSVADSDLKIVEGVFLGLGLMTWASFVKNRLPLLNLPEDILSVLRQGTLEYTKAKVIATILDLDERVAFVEQAITNNWSLSEIKQRISEKKTRPSNPNTESNNYKERFTTATTKLKKSRIWSDPKKRKQIEKLLSQLEALTSIE